MEVKSPKKRQTEEKPEPSAIEKRRLEFQSLLESILGSENVYYQPPSNINETLNGRTGKVIVRMNYPCIRYNLDYVDMAYANNLSYVKQRRYSVTYISREPDDDMVDKLSSLPMCRFDRFYTTSELNHYVFRIYY